MTRKKKTANNIIVYILMAMLVAGLGGFGITNFSGGGTSIATVGERDITAEDYFRALNQAVQAQQAAGATDVSFAALEAQGIPQQVRGQLLGIAALDNEADRLGLSVGDEEVARMITASSAYQGIDGKFDREAYEYSLDRNGFSVAEFENKVREESARNILQASVAAGVAAPEQMLDVLTAWFGERRTARWVMFDSASLDAPVPEPTDAELQEYHDANKPEFTLPEMKRITYALLTPEMMAGEVEVSEDDLRALYAERADEYIVPERRLVERLVFGTAEEAEEAKRAIEAGETDFAAVVEGRGLTLEDVDLGEVSEDDLGQESTAIFGLTEPGLVGPYPTDFGPALFRMNGILQSRETTFEQAQPELQAELGREKARKLIENMISDLDDRLAGGATVEDLADETEMELGTIDYWPGAEGGLAGYEGFREMADALTEKDFPEILTLDDGGIYAMRLDEVLEPRLQPLADVRDEVISGWKEAKTRALLNAKAEDARKELEGGKTMVDVAGLGVQTVTEATRSSLAIDAEPALAEAIFRLEPGESDVVDMADGVALVVLDEVLPADEENQQVALFRNAMEQQMQQAIAGDLFTYYAQYLTSSVGISIDDAGVNAVHTQLFR